MTFPRFLFGKPERRSSAHRNGKDKTRIVKNQCEFNCSTLEVEKLMCYNRYADLILRNEMLSEHINLNISRYK